MRVIFLSSGDILTLEKDTEILINARYWENRALFRDVVGIDDTELRSMESSFKEVGGFKASICLKAGTEMRLEKIETRKSYKEKAKYVFSIEKTVFNDSPGRYEMAIDPNTVHSLECSKISQADVYAVEQKKLQKLIKNTLRFHPKPETRDKLKSTIAKKLSSHLISQEGHDHLVKMVEEFSFENLEKNKTKSRKAMNSYEVRINAEGMKISASGSSTGEWRRRRLIRALERCKTDRSAEEYAKLIKKFDIESILDLSEELRP